MMLSAAAFVNDSHGDVSRVHATQAKLLDTSQNDCALTSTSACLSQDERFGRAHSSELLRREAVVAQE